MPERIKISIPIIVEGKYDKIKLDSILDADVFTTGGFSLFKRGDRLDFFRRISERGVIVLTDSDGAGTLIRSHISSAVPKEKIYQLYTPKIHGKEKRKTHASAEGTLGVEGIDADILRELFRPFADGNTPAHGEKITKSDLYEAGMSGGTGAAERRARFCSHVSLPDGTDLSQAFTAEIMSYEPESYYSAGSVRVEFSPAR